MRVSRILPVIIFFTCFTIIGVSAQVNLNNGLVAYYPFDGNANDASGNNNNPSFNNATLTTDRFGNANKAYYFNGQDTYMQIPNSPTLNINVKLSLCVWVKPQGFYHGPCHGNSILIKGTDYQQGTYMIRFDDGLYTHGANCSTAEVDTTHANFYANFASPTGGYNPYIITNQWHSVIATYDSDTGKIYVDCRLVATTINPGMTFNNASDLFFGKLNDPQFPYWLNGALDDIRIYNRALNQDEINALGSCKVQTPVVPSFTVPDTVCVNTPVNITNTSAGATTYYWNFCTADLNKAPEAVNLGAPGGLSGPVFTDFAYEDGNYYGFIVNNYSGTLTRLDFGSNILNTPTPTNLGSIGGVMKVNDEGIQVVKNNGKWYAFVVGGDPEFGTNPHIVKIEFGDKITNTPTATDWGNLGNMNQPVDLYMFQDGVNWYGYTVNAKNSTITRFSFSNDFSNPPVPQNLGNPGGYLNYPTGICAINDNGNWRVFITNAISQTLTRLDFGSSLLNNNPTAHDLGNPGGLFVATRDFTIMKSCSGAIGFAVNGPPSSDLVQLDFHGDLASTPSAISLGTNGGLNFPHSISKFFRVGPDVYSFITNVYSNTITRLRFPGCTNSSIPNSTAKNPPPVTYTQPGVYNINLIIDDSLPTQNSFCKQVVVLSGPALKFIGDTAVCSKDTVHLKVTGGASYTWSGPNLLNTTGSSVTALPAATSKYFVTGLNSKGCASIDSTVVNVNKCTSNCVIAPDFSFLEDVCNPKQFHFDNQTPNLSSVSWKFGDGQNADNISSPSIIYSQYGNYKVTLSAKNNDGCLDSITKSIVVSLNYDSLVINNDTLLCNGTSLKLNAVPALSYCWSPSAGLSAADIANPVATNLGKKITYHLNALVTGNNLIANGDFSKDTSGFSSSYKYSASGLPEGVFFVGSNPSKWHPNMTPCHDHTGDATSKMLMVNGSTTTGVEVWSETINVKKNTTYAFSTWLETIMSLNPAQLQFSINGQPVSSPFTSNTNSCLWNNFYAMWSSGETDTARISIVNMNSVAQGNDFALDDISFAETSIKSDSITIKTDVISVKVSGDTSICSGTSAQINAQVSPNAVYNWSPVQGLKDATAESPVASPATTTTYTLQAVSQLGCKASKPVKITVVPQPKVTSMSDTAICNGSSVQLLNTVVNGSTYKWSPSAGLSDPTLQSPLANPSTNTQYIISVNQGMLCTAKDTINIMVNPLPVVHALGDTVLCSGASVQLSASVQSNVTYQWSPSQGLNNTTVSNPLASPLLPTVYTVQVMDANKCSATASVTVNVNPRPVFSVTPVSKQICAGDGLTITASGGDSYQWYSVSGTINNPTSSTIQVLPQANAGYEVIINNSLCKLSDTLLSTVIVQQKPVATISKSNDIDCVLGSATLLATGGDQYKWLPATGLNNANIAGPVASPSQTTTYYVTVTRNGCSVTDSITVNVLASNAEFGYKMVSAFTPNNDGNNDCFGLKYWGGIKTLEFEVYNRWGNRVFYTGDAGKCWDGTFKGVPQPPGTYVYQIKATTICGNIYRKGTVVLIR